VDTKRHWEKVYTANAPDSVSWYRAHLETSLALIERAAVARSASIIDIGGGESTLVDDYSIADTKTSPYWMSRGPQSKSQKSGWVRPRSRCVGCLAISSKLNWNHLATTSGMTERCSIFLRHRSDALLRFGRLPAPLGRVAT
jgi:hypothetical protein